MKYLCLALLIAVGVAGCPGNQPGSQPATTCKTVGQQCQLGGGQLGVCYAGDGGKLECVSQH